MEAKKKEMMDQMAGAQGNNEANNARREEMEARLAQEKAAFEAKLAEQREELER